MNRLIRAVVASLPLVCAAQAALADDSKDNKGYQGAEQACGPSVTEGLSSEALAKMTADTRAVALKFFQASPDEQDRMLTPTAYIWSVGIGELDRARYVELHKPRSGQPDHGQPISHQRTTNFVIADGDRAAIDMENYVVFKDFTYDQKYHNLIVVRGGKVCALKIYSDTDMARRLIPDIDKFVKQPK
jgi:hypothetical protein